MENTLRATPPLAIRLRVWDTSAREIRDTGDVEVRRLNLEPRMHLSTLELVLLVTQSPLADVWRASVDFDSSEANCRPPP